MLERFKATPGEEVEMPELARIASGSPNGGQGLAVHARIGSCPTPGNPRGEGLRGRGSREGFTITNRVDRTVKPYRSFYRFDWNEAA